MDREKELIKGIKGSKFDDLLPYVKVSNVFFIDFKLFTALCTKAYNNIGDSFYSLKDVLWVFGLFFDTYGSYMGAPHPPIRTEQIEKIIRVMPILTPSLDEYSNTIEPGEYATLIDSYFNTVFKNCDYRINHFFSGDIRLMRYYEELL